jgi:hypothetical protein
MIDGREFLGTNLPKFPLKNNKKKTFKQFFFKIKKKKEKERKLKVAVNTPMAIWGGRPP